MEFFTYYRCLKNNIIRRIVLHRRKIVYRVHLLYYFRKFSNREDDAFVDKHYCLIPILYVSNVTLQKKKEKKTINKYIARNGFVNILIFLFFKPGI